jgi:hypothetical protein
MPPEDQQEATGAAREMTILEMVVELRVVYQEIENRVRFVQKKITRTENKAGIAEITLALRELQSSRHWLGEVLGALGQESPYKN